MRSSLWNRFPWIGAALTAVFALGGWFVAGYQASLEEHLLRQKLLDQAVAIARNLPPDLAVELKFSDADAGAPAFERIRKNLVEFSNASGIESIFTMALRPDGKVVFGPESLPPDSPLASPPGAEYLEPSDSDFETLREGIPTVSGPFSDEYGAFVGALAPVFDPRSGEILMAAGVDIRADDWAGWIWQARRLPLILTALLIVLLWGFVFLGARRRRGAGVLLSDAAGILVCGAVLALMVGGASHATSRAEGIMKKQERLVGFFNFYLEELRRIEHGLLSVSSFLSIKSDPSREEFSELVGEHLRSSAMEILGWAPRFLPQELDVAMAALAENGAAHDGLFTADANGTKIRPGSLDEYFVVLHVEPEETNSARRGFVINGERRRDDVIRRARDSGLLEGSEPLNFVGDAGGPPSFVLYSLIKDTAGAERGILAAGVRPETILSRASELLGFRSESISMEFLRCSAEGVPEEIPGDRGPVGETPLLSRVFPVFALGQTFALRFTEQGGEIGRRALASGLESGGFVFAIAILLAVVIGRQQLRQFELEAAVDARTHELQSSMIELERAAAESHRLAVEARKADQAKSSFLATMSHEIRTPLNGVVGFTQLLTQTSLSEEQKDFVETIRNSAETLLGLINDILDYSKIEAGKMRIEKVPFPLPLVIEEALDMVSGSASEKGIDLAYEIDPAAPYEVEGDPLRFKQVLINLLSNAVKFTAAGHVSCSVGILESAAGGLCRLRFSVADTGMGIPEDKLDRLFKVFSQVDSSDTRQFGGTGLGLAISRRLVELMGGEIGVKSRPGEGSTFWFNLPFLSVRDRLALEPDEPSPGMAGRRVLVVDDVATNRKLLENLLPAWGAHCVAVAGWAEAEPLVKSGGPFDLVLMDFQMPSVSGIEAATLLREMLGQSTPPIILLSSQTPDELPAIFSGKMMKPLKAESLLSLCLKVLGHPGKEEFDEDRPSLSPAASRLRVLVVEDSRVNQKLILLQLGRLGIDAVLAENGKVAVEAVSRGHFDAILLDCQMPEMDGFDATKSIRDFEKAHPERPRAWIIALTAGALQGDRILAFEAGMDDFLTKPLRIRDLVAALELAASKKS